MKQTLTDLFTSKKFLATLTALVIYVAGRFGLSIDPAKLDPVWQILLVYVGAQGVADLGKSSAQVKAAADAAVKTLGVLALMMFVASCGSTAKHVEVTAGHAVVDCAETEARAQAVNVMTPVVQAVIQGSTSADGKLIDTAPIKSALGKLTKDTLYSEAWTILSCAAKTAFAALAHPAPVLPGAPAAAPFVVDPAAVAKAEADVMATIAPGARFALAVP